MTGAAAASGTYNFKMVAGNDWNKDYGGNTTFPKNATGIVYYQPIGDTAAQLSGGAVAGKRYVFTAKNPGLSDTVISVMEITNPPAGIASVTGPTGAIATGSDLTFTVNLSAAPSPEEKVYIRATTDAFATSTIYPTTLAGSTATLTINDVSPLSLRINCCMNRSTRANLAIARQCVRDAESENEKVRAYARLLICRYYGLEVLPCERIFPLAGLFIQRRHNRFRKTKTFPHRPLVCPQQVFGHDSGMSRYKPGVHQ
ncbi:MAG: hypothetical protein U1G05_08605 [Kiritimatiellia bacterium]